MFLLFVVWVFLFDENAFIRQLHLKKEINNQKKEIERLEKLIKNDSTLISILKSDTLNAYLEKMLRENYLFSKPNEVIYKLEE